MANRTVRTVAMLSAFSRYHLDQIAIEKRNSIIKANPRFIFDSTSDVEEGEGEANGAPDSQKNPRKRRAPAKCSTPPQRQLQTCNRLNNNKNQLVDDIDRTNENTSENSVRAVSPMATPQLQQTSSQCNILESKKFKELPQELLNKIWWEYLQTSPGRRVWVYDTAFQRNGEIREIQFGFGARAPLPRIMCDSNFYRQKAFKELDFVEIKKNDSDPTGFIFDPLRDLIFLDQTQSRATQLEAFVAAMKRCNAQDKLRSISISHNLVTPQLLQQTVAHLNEFRNLELVLVAYNSRPRTSKDSALRIPFIISDVLDWPRIQSMADANKQTMEDAWMSIRRLGTLVPHISQIEYQGPFQMTLN